MRRDCGETRQPKATAEPSSARNHSFHVELHNRFWRHSTKSAPPPQAPGPLGRDSNWERTTAWNVVDHLKTKAEREAYLNAALEDGDASVVAAAIGDIARAEGMSKVARKTGLGREGLYKALSPDGNPALATILKVLRAFDFNLRAACL